MTPRIIVPRHGSDLHSEVARYLDMIHPKGGIGGKERPHGNAASPAIE